MPSTIYQSLRQYNGNDHGGIVAYLLDGDGRLP